MLLPKDFVSTMSDEEMDRIMDEADVLDERGEKEDPCKSYSCGRNEACSRPSKDARVGIQPERCCEIIW